MPSDEENAKYLYLVLTQGGAPTIDFDKVGGDLNLKKGATSKRWSRLKAAMKDGRNPGPSAYQFLWLCMKYNTREHAVDWNTIAKDCNTTSGAASKRYSRMKQAFEKGDPMPPVSDTKAANGDGAKRKRTPSKPKAPVTKKGLASEDEVDDNNDGDEEPDSTPTPKPKRIRGNATPVKAKKTTPQEVKTESIVESVEGFIDAAGNPDLLAELDAAVYAAGGETGDKFFDSNEFVDGEASEESKSFAQIHG